MSRAITITCLLIAGAALAVLCVLLMPQSEMRSMNAKEIEESAAHRVEQRKRRDGNGLQARNEQPDSPSKEESVLQGKGNPETQEAQTSNPSMLFSVPGNGVAKSIGIRRSNILIAQSGNILECQFSRMNSTGAADTLSVVNEHLSWSTIVGDSTNDHAIISQDGTFAVTQEDASHEQSRFIVWDLKTKRRFKSYQLPESVKSRRVTTLAMSTHCEQVAAGFDDGTLLTGFSDLPGLHQIPGVTESQVQAIACRKTDSLEFLDSSIRTYEVAVASREGLVFVDLSLKNEDHPGSLTKNTLKTGGPIAVFHDIAFLGDKQLVAGTSDGFYVWSRDDSDFDLDDPDSAKNHFRMDHFVDGATVLGVMPTRGGCILVLQDGCIYRWDRRQERVSSTQWRIGGDGPIVSLCSANAPKGFGGAESSSTALFAVGRKSGQVEVWQIDVTEIANN